MAKQYDFGKNQILRAEFLNALQDVLTSYLDIFLLGYSGANVTASASTTNPIAITINGRMRSIPTTLTAQPTGAAGTRDVFIVLRTSGFTLEAYTVGTTPTVSPGEDFRHVGTATWNGAAVTGVVTFASRINADYLNSRKTSYTPKAYHIARADDSGQLHPGWFPSLEAREEPLGSVQKKWSVSNASFSVPSGWVLMDGRTLTPAQHSFPGVGTIVVPDMRNKFARGADHTKTHNTVPVATNTAAGAPGYGGISGSNQRRDYQHNHLVGSHAHTVSAHEHGAAHTHYVDSHSHDLPIYGATHAQSYSVPADPREVVAFSMRTDTFCTEKAAGGYTSGSSHSTTEGGAAAVTTAGGAQTTTDSLTTDLDVRPAYYGLVYLLKVN